jgi:hypothetical protein
VQRLSCVVEREPELPQVIGEASERAHERRAYTLKSLPRGDAPAHSSAHDDDAPEQDDLDGFGVSLGRQGV